MICISIGSPSLQFCRSLLKERSIAMMEIRLDGVALSIDEIHDIFSLPVLMIATCRPFEGGDDKERKRRLKAAIQAGAAYVDIEIDGSSDFKKEMMDFAKSSGCRIILSYHNHQLTPSTNQLEHIVTDCIDEGADIIKIACQVHTPSECARIMALYGLETVGQKQILALGMGELGKITRIAAPLLGAPFTYASPEEGNQTAPGQLSGESLEEIYRMIDFKCHKKSNDDAGHIV